MCFLFFNIGIVLIGFGIKIPLVFWVFSTMFLITTFAINWEKYERGYDVNCFRSSLLTLLILLFMVVTFPTFKLSFPFWVYISLASFCQLLIMLGKKVTVESYSKKREEY